MKQRYTLLLVLLLLTQLTVFAQSKLVRGTVKDPKTNQGVPGVTVKIKGGNTATSTDVNGNFSIQVDSSGKKLIFSSLGFTTKTVSADQDLSSITMEESSTMLNETVVTALGVSKEKKSLGYAVSEVKAEDIRRSGEQNVIQSLASKAPGIQVTSSGGTPGASSKITLRGNQTFERGNQPLIVIDGVPVDNETNTANAADNPFNANLNGVNNSNRALDINPDDIESVSILKGPAAAALYGARAGNGAIIYTTKKGKFGKGLGITYSTNVELMQVNKLPKLQNKYSQGSWVAGVPTSITSDPGPDNVYGTGDDVSDGTPRSWGPTNDSLGITPVDNAKNFFQTGVTYTNNLAVDVGTDKTIYRFSIGNVDNKGIVPNTYLKRNTIKLTAEHKVTRHLNVGTTISYSNTRTQLPQNGSNLSGVMLGLLRTPSSYDLRDYQYANGFNKTYFAFYDNPYYTVYKNPFNQTVNRVFGNTYFMYKPVTWLDIGYKIGLDNYSDESRQIYAVSSNGDDNSATYGQVNYNTLNHLSINSDLLFTGRKNFGENFHSSLTLGNNVWHDDYKAIFSRGRNLSIPEFYNLGNASERYASNSQVTRRTYAYFFDGSIDYKSKVYLGITGRNEWSSTFGDKKKDFFYPGANLSFIVSEMLEMPQWFSFAKIRMAYAEAGISPRAYSSKTYYGQATYTDGFTNGLTFPYQGSNGYAISTSLGNNELKPETVKGSEAGIDFRFFNGRLNVDVTYYYQKTYDILLGRPIAPSSGYRELNANSGQMSNQGWEISLGGSPIKTDDFEWEINVNWAKNESKVLALADGVTELNIEEGFESIGSYAIVGQPYGAFYGTKYIRTSDGQLIINPATGLPYIDPKAQNLGNPYPDWLSGIRNTFTYKNLSFSFLWDIRKGGKIWNGTGQRLNNVGTSEESAVNREGTFIIPGVLSDGTDDANPTTTPNNVEINGFTYYRNYLGDAGGAVEGAIEDGSWVRLRDVSLSYRWDLSEKTTYLQYIDFSVSGRNVLLYTKYKGVDPETSLTGAGSNIQGFDYFNNPGTKSVLFGLKFGF